MNGFSRIEIKNIGDSFSYIFWRESREIYCETIAPGEVCLDTFYNSGELGSPDMYGPDGPPMIELVSATYVLYP